jgi:hypothetical protein
MLGDQYDWKEFFNDTLYLNLGGKKHQQMEGLNLE